MPSVTIKYEELGKAVCKLFMANSLGPIILELTIIGILVPFI
jgi:hypothetical protein